MSKQHEAGWIKQPDGIGPGPEERRYEREQAQRIVRIAEIRKVFSADLPGYTEALERTMVELETLLQASEEREKGLREDLEAATKYIAEQEGDWDMAGRFRGSLRPGSSGLGRARKP